MNPWLGSVLAMTAAGLVGCAATAASSGATAWPGIHLLTVRAGKTTLPYALYVPRGYTSRRSWPLIVFLHGSGECGSDGIRQLTQGLPQAILAAPERWPVLALFPQKPSADTEWEAWEEHVLAMLATTRHQLRVDPRRLVLTGLSQGGHGAWVLGARHADLWSAIVPVCGYLAVRQAAPGPTLDRATIARALAGVPVWAFHGQDDPVVPVRETEAMVAALREAGAEPRTTIYPDVGHGAWVPAYQEASLARWLLARRSR
ncbi:MAG TPA: PHB depolymerase family esterase [Thermoanaerobaculaceae bacterium]|nr:PHB depolymerase family esterase [Thermoanaerobaculaceae bacterium]HPS79432.1 PHB depolymerase family esterase [Thermoanaerobaculaceae bacterium]